MKPKIVPLDNGQSVSIAGNVKPKIETLDNGQSVSIADTLKPKIEPLDNKVHQNLFNDLDDILLKQERPDEPDKYVRPSVIVWNPMATIRRQTNFVQSLEDMGAANRN